jgi:hypothetical protein
MHSAGSLTNPEQLTAVLFEAFASLYPFVLQDNPAR